MYSCFLQLIETVLGVPVLKYGCSSVTRAKEAWKNCKFPHNFIRNNKYTIYDNVAQVTISNPCNTKNNTPNEQNNSQTGCYLNDEDCYSKDSIQLTFTTKANLTIFDSSEKNIDKSNNLSSVLARYPCLLYKRDFIRMHCIRPIAAMVYTHIKNQYARHTNMKFSLHFGKLPDSYNFYYVYNGILSLSGHLVNFGIDIQVTTKYYNNTSFKLTRSPKPITNTTLLLKDFNLFVRKIICRMLMLRNTPKGPRLLSSEEVKTESECWSIKVKNNLQKNFTVISEKKDEFINEKPESKEVDLKTEDIITTVESIELEATNVELDEEKAIEITIDEAVVFEISEGENFHCKMSDIEPETVMDTS